MLLFWERTDVMVVRVSQHQVCRSLTFFFSCSFWNAFSVLIV